VSELFESLDKAHSEGVLAWSIGKPAKQARIKLMNKLAEEKFGMQKPISVPWQGTNKLMGGLKPGELTILAGSPGSAKSYFALSICLAAFGAGVTWKYMPLEGDDCEALRRLVGIKLNNWAFVDSAEDQDNMEQFKNNFHEWDSIAEHLCENPRTPIEGLYGKMVPEIPWAMVKDWVMQEAHETKLIVIDPISLIDFASERSPQWKGEQDFIKDISGQITGTNCHVLLVCHFAKRAGRIDDDMDDVQGSSGFVRFAHNVILLRGHEEKETEAFVPGGYRAPVFHKRTLYIAKTRNGKGSGHKIAFNFNERGPVLDELGVFARRQ
jgi:predicted ATP-dependent serine protease